MKKIVIDGRLTADPVIKQTKAGKLATFSLANSDTNKDLPEYYNIIAWNTLSEIAEKNLTKGMKIVVAGSFKKDRYTGTDGKVKETFVIVAESFSFLPAPPPIEGGES